MQNELWGIIGSFILQLDFTHCYKKCVIYRIMLQISKIGSRVTRKKINY